MGNEFLHQMSTKKRLKMVITFKVRSYRNVTGIPHPFEVGAKLFLLFPSFRVGSEAEGYKLEVDSPVSSGGGRGGETPLEAEMMGNMDHRWNWNRMEFTTFDADHDKADPGNCS